MDFSNLKINGVSTDVRMTQRVLLNYLQGDSERDGKGVYSGYSREEVRGSHIRIPKPDLLPILPRHLGAGLNGGHYSGSVITITNEEYDLEILDVYDTVINVPYVALDMIPELKESDWSSQIGKALFIMKNGLCLANKFYQSFYADKANATVVEFDESKATEAIGNFRSCLDDAEDALNEGDIANGIDIFPEDTRRITYANGITKYIRAVGSFIVGGSNFGQELVKSGAYSVGDTKNVLEDGYHGTYGSVEMNLLSNMKLALADSYLGLPEGTIKNSGFCAVESSAYANVFALSDNGIVGGDFPYGRGKLLKPLYRMGATTIFTKGNAFVMKKGYVNPFDIFATLGGTPKILAKGSRPVKLTAVVTSAGTSAQTVKATKVTYDSTGSENVVDAAVTKYAYVQSDAAIDNVSDFIAAYKTATVKGTSTSASITASCTKGKYFNVIALGDESTVSAIASTIVA